MYNGGGAVSNKEIQKAHMVAAAEMALKLHDDEVARLKRKRQPVVLEEDEYTEAVEKIIRRDFFPELQKTQLTR